MKKILILIFSLFIITSCSNNNEAPRETNPEPLNNEQTESPTKKAEEPTSENTKNNPVKLTVVTCEKCNSKELAKVIKSKVLPEAEIILKSAESEIGKNIIEKFDAKVVPLFVLDQEAKNSSIRSFLSDITEEKDNQYLLLPETLGLNYHKELIGKIELNDFDYRSHGGKDSFIQIVEFSDFECPYCAEFYKKSFLKVKEKYGDQVSIIYKNFPLDMHKNAENAARAAQCAAKQDKFSQMHDVLFENNETLQLSNIKKYAADIQLSETEFSSCLNSSEVREEIEKQKNDGIKLGITGTPSFFIGKQFINGFVEFEELELMLDDLLGYNQTL